MRNNQKLAPPKPAKPKPPRKRAVARPPLIDGRPTKRTPEARLAILQAVEQGNSLDGAALYAGMSPETFREWRRTDPQMFEDVEKARQRMKVGLLAVIQRAAVTDKQWQAAAWKLERIFPEEYARKYQPMAMVSEQAAGEAPGKVYRVAIEPMQPSGEQHGTTGTA